MTERIGPGSVIAGRYQVESQLGFGGMAVVYRAEDIQLGRKVAVKVLHSQYAEDADFVERFRREAKAAAQLQHPGIVAVYDTGSWDGTWYIAMELLEGPTLKERLNAEGRIAPAEAVDLTEQILRAVRAAHRDGIIHRDLKPHNVILDEEGRPKVTDFGIARRGASDMTATGSILGTAHYIAPEQAQGEVITPRTDLYAVGVVLYEMLTGRTPFEGDSAVSIALAHVNNEPRSPRSIVPEIAPALDAVVMRALAKRPSDRFADADAFLAALGDAKRGIAPVYAPGTGEHPTAMVGNTTGGFDRRALQERRGTTGAMAAVPAPLTRGPWYSRPWAIGFFALLVIAGILAALLLGTTKRVTVPGVLGATSSVAQDRLEREGFQVKLVQRTSDQPVDVVVGQQPSGGTQVAKGSLIRLSVSQGQGTGAVPQVVGEPVDQAVDRLKTAGFKSKITKQSSDEIAIGIVISISPSGGSLAQRGGTVTVTVSSGKKAVKIPDLVDQPVDAARAQLAELGLLATTVDQESADKEVGTVLSISPAAGKSVRQGSTVALTVAAAPTTVDVPDVVGRSAASATSRLEDKGFTVKSTTEDTSDPSLDGKVISSDPAAGESQDQGSTVTIVVGSYTAPTTPATSPSTTTP